MGERVIRAPDFQLRKCAKREQSLEDRISQLPTEILIYILSFLTLKEAVRASFLSKRWVNLWKFVDRLDFDASKVLAKLSAMAKDDNPKHDRLLKRKRRKYVKWVNEVLQSHKALALDEFRIYFDLDKSSRNEIDKWLHYAFAKRVQRLELNLSEDGVFAGGSSSAYTFPLGLLGLSGGKSSEQSPSGYCNNGIHPCALLDFKSLRTLSLRSVNVTGEVLKFFLHNCPFLEHLLVDGSRVLESVEVCGPSIALQHLEIRYCFPLKSIIVHNTKLVSLTITQSHNLVLSNVPMLVDVWVSGAPLRHIISRLSCCLSKLEVLTLGVSSFAVAKEKSQFLEVPQLSKLKQLILVVNASKDDSLICLTPFIRASPNLEKFVLKLQWDNVVRKQRKVIKGASFPLQHLKVVELYGYYGRASEVELVKYFLENALALKKIIVDPRDQTRSCFINDTNKQAEKEKVARSYAKQQLEGLIPSPIELVFL